MSSVQAVRDAVKQFETLQDTHAAQGAGDTEPDGVFQDLILKALRGGEVVVPMTAHGWELYSSDPQSSVAAVALAAATEACVQAIRQCPIGQLPALEEYLTAYCWRCAY